MVQAGAVHQLILEAEVTNLDVIILFNDIVVQEINAVEPVRFSARLGGWAVSGANALNVESRPLARPSERKATLIIRVRRIVGDSEAELVHYERPSGSQGAQQHSASFPFEPVATWKWVHADALAQLTDAAEQGIIVLLSEVRDALADKNIQQVVALQAMQISEQASASGGNPSSSLAAYETYLTRLIGSGDWRVDPVEPAKLQMRRMGGGRVVQVTGKNGTPAITCHSNGGSFAMAPYVARVSGKWQIVR